MNVRPGKLPFSVVRERPTYHLRLWGRFSADYQGADVRPRSRKARALLAYLTLRGSEPIERARAGALLWSERGDEQANASLRQVLQELRALAREPHPLLIIDRQRIRLDPAVAETDLQQIEALTAAANVARLAQLFEGAAMRLLDDLDGIDPAFDEWLAAERAMRHEAVRRATLAAAEQAIEKGENEPAVTLAARLAELDPYDEATARLEMRAHAGGGDRDAVRRRYRRLEATLAAELGTRPHAETTSLFALLTGAPAVQSVPDIRELVRAAEEAEAEHPPADEAPIAPPAPAPRIGRRTMIIGSAAAALTVAGGGTLWWRGGTGHVPTPEARRFYDEGMRAQYLGFGATTEQAEAYFRQATEADPEWADAWGSLAMSYRHMLDGETNVSQWRLVEQTRSAAARALALDPDNGEALVALALIRSPYRRWAEAEAEYRSVVERFPNAFVMRGHFGRLLRDLGRFGEAAAQSATAVQQQPFIPFVSLGLSTALWGAGRLHEAEAEVERGFRRWPKNPAIWFNRAEFLIYTGRPSAALAFASDREGWPAEMPPFLFERRMLVARALETRAPADVTAAVESQRVWIQRSLAQPPSIIPAGVAVPFFAHIGDLETSFALLDGYFFDRGAFAPPAPRQFGPLTRRETAMLLMGTCAPLRQDRRFRALLEEIGLVEHWRRSNTRPDLWRSA